MSTLIADAIDEIRDLLLDFPTTAKDPLQLLRDLAAYVPRHVRESPSPSMVFLHPDTILTCGIGTEIQPFTTVSGHVVLGDGVHIGSHCSLRGPLFLGNRVRIGSRIDVARSCVLSNTQCYHHSDIFDSVIGRGCWLAYLQTYNVRADQAPVRVHWPVGDVHTQGEHKYGATIEDDVQLPGLHMLMPGTYLAPGYRSLGPAVVSGHGDSRSLVT